MLYGLIPWGGASFNPQADIPDLSGKVIFITGGNIGLGRETILQLSHHNPSRIYLAARTESKALAAIQEIQIAAPKAPITFIQCDLTSFASIQTCAREFIAREKRLDILYLNAGIMATPPGMTEEGYEVQFGTNHMGHALLTKLLLPTLLQTAQQPGADVRVVVLSSFGHIVCSGVAFEDLKTDMRGYITWKRYGQSKLANILFVKELARRYPSITAVAVHPGIVNTELYRSVSGWFGIGWVHDMGKGLVYTSIPEGARCQLWAGTGKKAEGTGKGVKSGEYYTPIGLEGQGTNVSNDAVLAGRLWVWTEKELEGWKL